MSDTYQKTLAAKMRLAADALDAAVEVPIALGDSAWQRAWTAASQTISDLSYAFSAGNAGQCAMCGGFARREDLVSVQVNIERPFHASHAVTARVQELEGANGDFHFGGGWGVRACLPCAEKLQTACMTRPRECGNG